MPVTRDIIVIGASAGGIDALRRLVSALPADLGAAVFAVQHVGQRARIGPILDKAGPLKAADAEDGEEIRHGRVYVAPAGYHLLIHDQHVMLRRGPRENLSRPAVDPLFRSAACTFGSRVIGVVLTGALNDGASGLRAIKRCGGCAIVQDPDDAVMPDMPRNALRATDVDYCVPLSEIGELLVRLSGGEAGPTKSAPSDIVIETMIAAQEYHTMDDRNDIGAPAPFTCPSCSGPLWEVADGTLLRYRCRVGHAFTAHSMLQAQGDEIEQTLWNLLQSHQQRARLTRRLAEREHVRNAALAKRLFERADDYDQGAETVRRFLAQSDTGQPSAETE